MPITGMDSSKLLSTLLGDDADRLADEAKARHAALYEEAGDLLRVLPGARELISTLSDAGLEVRRAGKGRRSGGSRAVRR